MASRRGLANHVAKQRAEKEGRAMSRGFHLPAPRFVVSHGLRCPACGEPWTTGRHAQCPQELQDAPRP